MNLSCDEYRLPSNVSNPVRVLLITEGTYPFHWGGVSTWCHLLLRDLPQVDFTLMGIVSSPRIKVQFELPKSVRQFISIPLWGIRDVLETRRELSLLDIVRRKRQTTEALVTSQFIPLVRPFLQAILGNNGEPEYLGQLIHQMYRRFLAYDFDTILRSRAVWDCFVQVAQAEFPRSAARHGYPNATFTLADIAAGMQWLHHWLFPLAKPLPQVDVVHAALVGLCTMVSVAVKLEYGAGYLLTEHGIYLRESYLAEASISEAFPFSILEAMLCGKPVVATAVGGVPEQIAGCGIAVEPRNPPAMAEAILALMNDPANCAALGCLARQKAAEQFSVRQSSSAHYSSYLSLSRRHHSELVLTMPSSIESNREKSDEILQNDDPMVEAAVLNPSHRHQLLLDHQRLTSITWGGQFKVLDTDAVAALALDISRQAPLPIDSFEITALLESLGITDEVAAQRYGVPDVFTLAEAVLTQVRDSNWQLSSKSEGSRRPILFARQ